MVNPLSVVKIMTILQKQQSKAVAWRFNLETLEPESLFQFQPYPVLAL